MPLTIDYIPAEITLTTFFFLLPAKYIPWIADLDEGQSLEDCAAYRALITLHESSCTRMTQTHILFSLSCDIVMHSEVLHNLKKSN